MASHMGVQTFATERNSQVEFFIHFILEEFFFTLRQKGQVIDCKVEMQSQYVSDIASDVWDHHINIIQTNGRELEVWCQTTSYKGNGTGKPEPNKTYEVRETLVEGLSIRQKFNADKIKDYRSIHFTVGDSAYTYKWFMDLKASVYDSSIYIGESGYDIFREIDELFQRKHTENDKHLAFKKCIKGDSHLAKRIIGSLAELNRWWNNGIPITSALANLQWNIVEKELTKLAGKWPDFTKVKGKNIKGQTNALIFSEDANIEDPLIRKTAVKMLAKNPFLSAAIQITGNWDDFIKWLSAYNTNKDSLENFIQGLWNIDGAQRLVLRRLLLRIHTSDSIAYVQDIEIKGITEHNIYSKDYSEEQANKIIDQIVQNLSANEITSVQDLISKIKLNGKKLINQARWFEAKNGTELKPSFDYVEIALSEKGYKVVTPSMAKVNARGYHAEISTETVRPYTNLKVVISNSGKALCLIKAKFFRSQEFPRRCKEEAFVGLTLKNAYMNDAFSERTSLPLVMFVDMDAESSIPEYAIKRLMSFGWKPVFSIDELLVYLKELETK